MQYYFNNKFSLGNYVQKEFKMIPVDIVVELDDPINICCAYSDGMVGFEFTVEPAQLQFVVMDCLRVVTNDLSGIIVRFDLEVDDNFIYDNPNPIEGLIV